MSYLETLSKRMSWKIQPPKDVEKREPGHYNDWPNDPGFVWQDETREPIDLEVTGAIPDYVRGVLYRTGPGGDQVETEKGPYQIQHWFDGFSLNHRFEIHPEGRVSYRSRRGCDQLLEYAKKNGTLDTFSFGQKRDPCESFFRKIMGSFQTPPLAAAQGRAEKGCDAPSLGNVCVTLSPNMPGVKKFRVAQTTNSSANGHGGIETLTAKTDATMLQRLDPETLEPIGLANQRVLHPALTGQMSAAHARTCPETGEFFNFNLKMGGPPEYKLFKISPEGVTTIIGTVYDAPASYLHSFFLTKKYLVLCVWNSKFSWGGAKVVYDRNILDAIAPFDPTSKAKFFVVDRSGEKGVVATYESDAFFAFHSINAYDTDGDILLDVPVYENLDVLHSLYYRHLKSSSASAAVSISKFRTKLTRFRLAGIPATQNKTVRPAIVEFADDINMELPSINPNYICEPYRYVYAVAIRGKASWVDGIVKHDLQNHTSTFWEKHGHSPSEPIFVADPNGKDEDDGVLLTVVLDGHNEKSYLLVLNAKDLTEVAKAEVGKVVSFGFHGTYVGLNKQHVLSI